MGLTLTAQYNGAPSWDMGYITFGVLRMDIADEINKEYGEHYREMYSCPRSDWTEYNKKTANLEKKHKLGTRTTDFLWIPDSDGKLSPFKCKALLDAIQGMENNKHYGYVGFGLEHCMTIEDFKNLLKECFDRRCYMIWR